MVGLGGRRQRRKWQLIGALGTLTIVVSVVYAIRQIMHGGLQRVVANRILFEQQRVIIWTEVRVRSRA